MSIGTESPTRRASQQEPSAERRGTRRIVSPFRCRVWTQHSRPEEQLTEDACTSLRDSIARNGQHQPALGRPVSGDPDFDIEIICGARRHAVARTLGRDLLVEVRPMNDAEAYVAMYEENLLREEDSPYVRGQILWRAFRSGTYPSQEDLSRAFDLSHSAVSRLLMLAQLPSLIVGAFQSPADIREGWGVELFKLWNEDDRREAIAARARAIATRSPRPSSRAIYELLITPPGGKPKNHRSYRNIPVRGAAHAVLFHEQDRLEHVLYIIPKTLLSPERRETLKRSMVRILEENSVKPGSMPPS